MSETVEDEAFKSCMRISPPACCMKTASGWQNVSIGTSFSTDIISHVVELPEVRICGDPHTTAVTRSLLSMTVISRATPPFWVAFSRPMAFTEAGVAGDRVFGEFTASRNRLPALFPSTLGTGCALCSCIFSVWILDSTCDGFTVAATSALTGKRTKVLEPPIHLDPVTNFLNPLSEPPMN